MAEVSVADVAVVFSRAYAAIVAYLEAGITTRELSMGDFLVLEILLHKGSLPATTIAEKIPQISRSAAAAAARLEKRGLVRRRGHALELTVRGRALANDLYRQHV